MFKELDKKIEKILSNTFDIDCKLSFSYYDGNNWYFIINLMDIELIVINNSYENVSFYKIRDVISFIGEFNEQVDKSGYLKESNLLSPNDMITNFNRGIIYLREMDNLFKS